jgi:hypothetical protein
MQGDPNKGRRLIYQLNKKNSVFFDTYKLQNNYELEPTWRQGNQTYRTLIKLLL